MIPTALLALLAGCLQPAAATETPAGEAPPASEETQMSYPETRRGDVVDTHHGTEVPDPYRWLEEPDSEETRAWVDAQNELTHAWLGAIDARQPVEDRLRELWDYERYGMPVQRGGRYFWQKNDGLQDQDVLYVAEGLHAEPRALLDPNALSEDGTISLAEWSPSRDGRYLAYALSDGGSDWLTWHVRDVATGDDLEDTIEWSKFSDAAWAPDGSGFYYAAYDEPDDPLEQVNLHQKLYFHRLGTQQAEDRLVHATPEHPEWGFGPRVTDDGELLTIHVWRGTDPENALFLQRLDEPDAPVEALLDDFDAYYWFLGKQGRQLYLQTDLDAPRGRVVRIDLDQPAREHWVEIVPEGEDTLQDASIVGDTLFLRYLHHAKTRVARFGLDGTPRADVDLPGIGTAEGFGGRMDATETFFSFTHFARPTTIYRYDLETGAYEVFQEPEVDLDPEQYVTEQVFYESADGTRVPMFITRRRDLEPTGDRPVLLNGYGGFRISLTPAFRLPMLVWMEMGGVLAIPNLRGGGEYGREWHEAGTEEHKQNVFDDFAAAGEWLVASGWTRPDRLGIMGRSNGGLLVGASVQQRPDLFGAAVAGVGVMDMLRYHLFTIGWAWASDYGTVDDPELFEVLHAYSPVHNAEPDEYPPILVTTGDHDDRVVPAHSYKFAAAMQRAQQASDPVLIRVETRAGHGAGTPTRFQIEQAADELAFLVRALDFQPTLPAAARD